MPRVALQLPSQYLSDEWSAVVTGLALEALHFLLNVSSAKLHEEATPPGKEQQAPRYQKSRALIVQCERGAFVQVTGLLEDDQMFKL